MSRNDTPIRKGISYFYFFRFIFVLFFVYHIGNVIFLWDGYKDSAIADFLPSVALTSTLWIVIALFTTLLAWCIFKALESFSLKMGWDIKIEHFLLYISILILVVSLIWIVKKSILPNIRMTFKLKSFVFIFGAFISIFPTRLFYDKAEELLNIVQKRITPLVWAFSIVVIFSIPPTVYLIWQEIQLYSSSNSYGKDLQALVTFIFDDNYEKIYTRAKPIFDAQGEVACAAVVLDYIGRPGRMTVEQMQELQKSGWEILSHSVTHSDLTALTRTEVEDELKKSKFGLEDLGFKVDNFVYPFNRHNATVRMIARKYYRSARSGDQWKTGLNINPHVPRMYALSAVNLESPAQLEELMGYVNYAGVNNYWLIIAVHNVHPYIETILNSLIDYIQSKDIKIVTINQALNLIGNRRESKISRYLFILNNDSPGNILRNIHIVTQKVFSKFQDTLLNL